MGDKLKKMSDMFSALSEGIELCNEILTEYENENEKEAVERFLSATLEYVDILSAHLQEVIGLVGKKVKKRKLNEVIEYSLCVLEVLALFIGDEYLDCLDGMDILEEVKKDNYKIKSIIQDITRVSFPGYPDFPDNTELIESAESNIEGVLRAMSEETKSKTMFLYVESCALKYTNVFLNYYKEVQNYFAFLLDAEKNDD